MDDDFYDLIGEPMTQEESEFVIDFARRKNLIESLWDGKEFRILAESVDRYAEDTRLSMLEGLIPEPVAIVFTARKLHLPLAKAEKLVHEAMQSGDLEYTVETQPGELN